MTGNSFGFGRLAKLRDWPQRSVPIAEHLKEPPTHSAATVTARKRRQRMDQAIGIATCAGHCCVAGCGCYPHEAWPKSSSSILKRGHFSKSWSNSVNGPV